jgi:hypothetical protein
MSVRRAPPILRPSLWRLVRAWHPALWSLALAGCGGGAGSGGGSPGTASPSVQALSADQRIYESVELHGGSYSLLWNLPYGGGALVSGVNYFAADGTGGLAQSPAVAGPQVETPVIDTLSSVLPAPYQLPQRFLQSGRVQVRSAGAARKVSYQGSAVRIDYLADDGATVVESALFSDFSSVALDGPMGASPEELQAAYPVGDWIGANHFTADAAWLAGAAYSKRHGAVLGDTYVALDCTDTTAPFLTTGNATAPCASATTLAGLFPVTLYDAGGHPCETDFAGDGSVVTVQGLRMWIAQAPLAAEQDPTTAYRVFYEAGGNVYMGVLWRDATAFRYLQADGSAVDYLVGLNQAATASVQAGLVVTTVAPGSPSGTVAEVPTVDLFGIGGHGVNGALAPADLAAHYGVPSDLDGSGQTIAIVDAPGSGAVADDLNVFSAYYGLPQCNSLHPCLQVVDLSGGAPVAPANDWGPEVAMDTQLAHAMAPGATLLLVTANSASTADLLAAVNYAAAQPGVSVVSMSFSIGGEPASTYLAEDQLLAGFQSTQGTVFFAASGDGGYNWQGASYPAASPYATGVGGTRIGAAGESAWQFSGGGPSSYAPMPAWQSAYLGSRLAALNGGMRATPDVAAVADYEHSAVAVYYKQRWFMAGGTSVSTPLWAGVGALFGQYLLQKQDSLPALVRATPGGFNGLLYQARLTQGAQPGLVDIVGGSSNLTAQPCALCSAASGYDDATGLGTPSVAALFGAY